MILFFDNGCSWRPNKNVQYVGSVVYYNSIPSNENLVRIVVSDRNVIDFFKSWEKDITNSPDNVATRKTIYLMDYIGLTTGFVSSHIKNIQKDFGWCGFKPISYAYEVILVAKYIEHFSSRFYSKLLKPIIIRDIRGKELDKIFNNE